MPSFLSFSFLKMCSFLYFWLCWVFIAMCGLSLVVYRLLFAVTSFVAVVVMAHGLGSGSTWT